MRGRILPRLQRRLGKHHPVVRRLNRWLQPARFGTLRRTTPLSSEWGADRGTPVDRYYIEGFLEKHRGDIRGRVLEILDASYTKRFGTDVVRSDVLDIDETNPEATIIADLSAADDVPSGLYDCFILTQTLQLIPDTRSVLRHSYRILRPGGVLLLTVPSITRVVPRHEAEADYWRFTADSCEYLLGDIFGHTNIEVVSYGNVLSAMSFLTGVSSQELSTDELDIVDKYFPVTVAVRARKQYG